jgi:hypothetical protein
MENGSAFSQIKWTDNGVVSIYFSIGLFLFDKSSGPAWLFAPAPAGHVVRRLNVLIKSSGKSAVASTVHELPIAPVNSSGAG